MKSSPKPKSGRQPNPLNRKLITARVSPICALLVQRGARKRMISEGVLLDEIILHGIAAAVKLDQDETALLEAARLLETRMANVTNLITKLNT